jgi:hypothetical protein
MLNTFSNWKSILAKLGSWRAKCGKAGKRYHIQRPLRLEAMEERHMLATLTVNSFADTHINTDGVLTLREAVEVVQQGNTNGLDSTTIQNQISGSLGNDIIYFASEK